jgi:hypothetical protein
MYSALTASDEICMQRAQPRGVPCLQDGQTVGLSWESHDERELETVRPSDVSRARIGRLKCGTLEKAQPWNAASLVFDMEVPSPSPSPSPSHPDSDHPWFRCS